ncbi:hypothetical protein GE061_000057 [Apolygus lucorum]|uniref:Uncharacterized protein n=1 Tax=Apolygus lucorum TaxID=248454 RepID=A0A6A4KM76_APOLU|nr:hypothetical protein GE061_000057 [Apolygus lucorum]
MDNSIPLRYQRYDNSVPLKHESGRPFGRLRFKLNTENEVATPTARTRKKQRWISDLIVQHRQKAITTYNFMRRVSAKYPAYPD